MPIFQKPETPLIQRLRNLENMIPDTKNLGFGAKVVIVSLELFQGIQKLAAEAADALEGGIEIPIYDIEEIHHGCTVQVLTSSVTGESSVGWWKEEDNG